MVFDLVQLESIYETGYFVSLDVVFSQEGVILLAQIDQRVLKGHVGTVDQGEHGAQVLYIRAF